MCSEPSTKTKYLLGTEDIGKSNPVLYNLHIVEGYDLAGAIREFNKTLMKCKECGKYFELTWSEKLFFEQKGLSIPKRCRPCRAKRKKAKSGDNE